jgi:predicted DNA-binding transcriptional regulator YafY
MPKNKNAIIRYRIIDACLRNKFKKFPTKFDFINACENLGSVSLRTIEKDLYDMMYDEELKYFAPIAYSKSEKGYYYEDPVYSISNFPINEEDLSAIAFACSILRQFGGIDPAKQLLDSIEKLENYLHANAKLPQKSWETIIQAETSTADPGFEFMSPILECIKNSTVFELNYKRFNSEQIKTYSIHPYLLKQYRNRWYVIGFDENRNDIGTFALDRIMSLIPVKETFNTIGSFNALNYHKYAFGIHVSKDQEPEKIRLKFLPQEAAFIKSQPLHGSQVTIEDTATHFIIEIEVWVSFELVNSILGFGERVEVLSPETLRQDIINHLKNTITLYQSN